MGISHGSHIVVIGVVVLSRVCRHKISASMLRSLVKALQTCLPIPLPTHRWLILGIAHGSHAVIGVVVLSEGLET